MRLFQASQAAVTIASYPAKTRLESLVWRRNCQTFSTGFSSGDLGGGGSKERLCGRRSLSGGMPTGLVEHEDGMRLWGKVARDLIKVMLHRLRVGARHDHGRPRAAFGADRAEQIGGFG